jgi:predicted nucleotidyltransferase component of viral defense system
VQNLARRSGRPTDELLHLYALEGFLDRLARSEVADRLVLKGGMLLSIWNARRPTRDIDLAGRRIKGEVDVVCELVAAVASMPSDDGLEFDPAGITAGTIRDQDDYAGVRVTVPGQLARARFRFHVDVNVGDPIQPPPVLVDLPRLLGGEPVRLLGYPIAMVLAEKLVTMVERGEANTRWRDFADVYRLVGDSTVAAAELRQAVEAVATFRGVRLRPLAGLLDTLAPQAQGRWAAWRSKQQLDEVVPEQFADVLEAVVRFADQYLRS